MAGAASGRFKELQSGSKLLSHVATPPVGRLDWNIHKHSNVLAPARLQCTCCCFLLLLTTLTLLCKNAGLAVPSFQHAAFITRQIVVRRSLWGLDSACVLLLRVRPRARGQARSSRNRQQGKLKAGGGVHRSYHVLQVSKLQLLLRKRMKFTPADHLVAGTALMWKIIPSSHLHHLCLLRMTLVATRYAIGVVWGPEVLIRSVLAKSSNCMQVQADMWNVPPLHETHMDISKSLLASKGTGFSDGIRAGGDDEPQQGSISGEPNSATPDVVARMANVHSTASRGNNDEVRYG